MLTAHRLSFSLHLRRSAILLLAVLTFLVYAAAAGAQTTVTAPKNRYTPAQDVELGQKAATQVVREMPLVRDSSVESYVQAIGRRLVASIPARFQHQEFQYRFQVVNARDLNAFALPGGPMFVNRGMLQGVRNEGEIAGVMAHELSHVALRHGTAQATKATPYEIGAIAGQILGSIVGGTAGQVIATGSRFGIGTAFLRFSREYEKQADILGSQIMAAAGYDPRDMAAVFKMLEEKGASGAPEWLSDHPNPGNRYAYITREADALNVRNASRDTGQLASVQSELRSMPPAKSMREIEQAAQAGNSQGNTGTAGDNIPVGTSGSFPPPSSRYRTYDEGGLFRISVPENWQALSGENAVRFSPPGAYGQINGQQAFLLGVEVGVISLQARDLRSASRGFVDQLMQSNPNLRPQTNDFQRTTIADRDGLRLAFTNVNEAGEPEVVVLQTTELDDGSLFYTLNVAPQNQFASYQSTFRQVTGSIQFRR